MTDRQPYEGRFELALLDLMPRLTLWARQRTYTADAANDLLQETLLRALQGRDGFVEGTNLGAWLYMIMRNLAADEGRRRARRGPHLAIDDNASLLGEPPRQDHDLALRDLQRAFAELPAAQQELLLRIAAGGERYLDLAEAYGVAIGTVKSRVARARANLRRRLDPADGVDGGPCDEACGPDETPPASS